MSTIKTGTTSTTGYVVEADTTGAFVVQTGTTPTTALSISASGVVTFPATTTIGTLYFGAGTVTAPSISTTGDSNTGIYFPAADTIAFTEGGVESARFDSSGNFGIGTSSPNYKLHVTTNIAVGASGFNQQLLLGNNSIQSQLLGTGYTNMSIQALGGNLGVGTTSPSTKLHVKGSGSYDGSIFADNSSTTGGGIFGIGVNGTRIGFLSSAGSALGNTSQDLALYNETNNGIRFYTNSAERARIPATGGIQSVNSISVGDATPTTSGAGITFPATQSASSDANTLDDYEEGTFTPSLVGTSSNPTVTYGGREGRYTKIGNIVYFNIYIYATAYSGGSGNLDITGLPFTSASGGLNAPALSAWSSAVNFPAGYTSLVPIVIYGDTRIWCTVCGDNIGYGRLVVGDFAAGAEFRISGIYSV